MYKTIAILLSLLLVFGMLSCNLDGSGIFLTISESTEIADSNLATEPVREILYKDTNTMYVLHGTSLKRADISVPDPIWNNVDFSKPISEAVFIPGSTNKLVFSSAHTADSFKSVYVGTIGTTITSTIVAGLGNVNVIDIIIDGTTVYAITYNTTTDIISISEINVGTSVSNTINTFSSAIAPTAVHFVSPGVSAADTEKHFIFIHYDDTQGYINSYLTLSDLSTATAFTEFLNSVFELSDDTTKNSQIIGAYADGTTIYLVTNEGILITSTDNLTSFIAVNNNDPSEFMSLVLTSAITSIPMTVVTIGTTELLLIGGLSGIYYYDIASPSSTDIPLEFTSDDAFYSSLSSTPIMDFYNVPGDFPLYTATSDKWIWQTTDEESVSTQLL